MDSTSNRGSTGQLSSTDSITGGGGMHHSQSTPAGVDGGGGARTTTPPATPKKGGKMLAIRVQMLDDTVTIFQVQVKRENINDRSMDRSGILNELVPVKREPERHSMAHYALQLRFKSVKRAENVSNGLITDLSLFVTVYFRSTPRPDRRFNWKISSNVHHKSFFVLQKSCEHTF